MPLVSSQSVGPALYVGRLPCLPSVFPRGVFLPEQDGDTTVVRLVAAAPSFLYTPQQPEEVFQCDTRLSSLLGLWFCLFRRAVRNKLFEPKSTEITFSHLLHTMNSETKLFRYYYTCTSDQLHCYLVTLMGFSFGYKLVICKTFYIEV